MGRGGLGTRSIGYRKGLVDSFRGHLGRKGHQYKVDMAKSNKERESCSPARN